MAKDTSKYNFKDSSNLGKGRLVQAVIKQYVSDNSPTYQELLSVFPSSLQGSSVGVVINHQDLDRKKAVSTDSKDRYFIGESDEISTKDGEYVFVSSQWGKSNIDDFISHVEKMGYIIKKVDNMSPSIRELFDEYKASPRVDWVNSYRDRCEQLSTYKGKAPSQYDEGLLKDIWLIPANGIASARPGFLSNEEFLKLQSDLPVITSKIVEDPSSSTHDEVIEWAKRSKKDKKFNTIKWGVINRVFSAAAPQLYSSLLNENIVNELINILNNTYRLNISTKGNWAKTNINLRTAIQEQGLDGEDDILVNTFLWQIYEQLTSQPDKKSPTQPTINRKPSKSTSFSNTIFYGPPGTGKTYRLQQILRDQYTDRTSHDITLWLTNEMEKLSWHEIIILIVLDSSDPIKVNEIINHQYFQLKAQINERTANLRATAWAALQNHTIAESTTVKYSSRREPLVFDKTSNSFWKIVDDRREQLEGYQTLLDNLKAGPKTEEPTTRYEFVTFHQSYGYEEFVEGLRPVTNESGDISYEIQAGVFKRICRRAIADPENQYAIVIDEINRGNISKIFGELITLLETDKRIGMENQITLTLPYSQKPFSVPANLTIIGTMNTADRSLTHIDVALRRRFDFIELRTDYSLLSNDVDGVDVSRLLYAINQRIQLLLDREHIIGHALLMNVKTIHDLESTFKTKIIPLLEEYFFENWGKIKSVFADNAFVQENQSSYSIWLGIDEDNIGNSYQLNSDALSIVDEYKNIYSKVPSAEFPHIAQE
jgi:5-methylcytosine-specific restriction protein B